MAHFKSSRPDAKTLIFYNHYDTVPADGVRVWTEDPLTLRCAMASYGRGVDDDKGHNPASFECFEKIYAARHRLSIVYHMEGAENRLRQTWMRNLEKHADKLREDCLGLGTGTKNT